VNASGNRRCMWLVWGSLGVLALLANEKAVAAPDAISTTALSLRAIAGTRNAIELAQSTDGTIWFIADGQLCRYEGVRPECLLYLSRVKHLVALPNGGVLAAVEESNKFVQIVSESEGPPLSVVSSLKVESVTALCWWRGLAWAAVGTTLRPVLTSDEKSHSPIDFGQDVIALSTFNDSGLYVVLATGTVRLDTVTGSSVAVRSADIDGHEVTSVAVDSFGDLWVGTRQGLWHNGLVMPTNSQIEGAFPFRAVNDILIDHERSVWVASTTGLIQLRQGDPILVSAAAEGLGGQVPFSILVLSDNDIWLTDNHGISHWDGEAFSRFGVLSGFRHIDLRTLAFNTEGGLWIGGIGSGLWSFKEGRALNVPITLPAYAGRGVRSLLTTSDGNLWIGFETGGMAKRSPAGKMVAISLDPDNAMHMVGPMVENEGTLWIGFRDGGFGRILEGKFERLGAFSERELTAAQVFSIAIRPGSEAVWLGTKGKGLLRYRNGRLSQLTTSDGLPSNNIHSLTADVRGRLWAGTEKGVFVVDLAEAENRIDGGGPNLSVSSFDERDGMRSVETINSFTPAAAITSNALLWQPTTNGVVVFDTQHLPFDAQLPRMIFGNIGVNGRPLKIDEVSVGVGNGELDARIVCPIFISSHRLVLRYRFRSAMAVANETPWIDLADERHIALRGLLAGSYVLEAQAFFTDNPARIVQLARALTLNPPIYRTIPFYLVVLLFVVLVVATRYRARSARARSRFGVVLAERRRISRDMHDSLQQDLVGLKFHIETALITDEIKGPARLHLEKAAELASEGVRDLRDAISGLAAASLSVGAIEQRIATQLDRLFSGSGVKTNIHRSGPSAVLSVHVATAVMQITREAVTNVQKHSKASQLSILLRADVNTLTVQIEDNGHGIASDSVHFSGIGFDNMRHRAKEADILLNIQSSQGKGCCVTLTAPIAQEDA